MFCVSSGRAGDVFRANHQPTPTIGGPRGTPHQPDLPENQYSYRPPPQTPIRQPQTILPHLLSTLRTPFRHSRVPIPILGSQLQPALPHPAPRCLLPSRPVEHPRSFSFCHSNPQACILPSSRLVSFRFIPFPASPVFPSSNLSPSRSRPFTLSRFHPHTHTHTNRFPSFQSPPATEQPLLVLPRATRLARFLRAADSANHPYWLNNPLKRPDIRASIKMRPCR